MNTTERNLQWLIDRAQIGDLLINFASALDTRDWAAYAANYAEGGLLELPDPERPGVFMVLRKEDMLEVVPKTLGRYSATHHMSTNQAISIDGETAHSRSYLHAVHVRSAANDHWSAGGWYDCEYVRSPQGWRFTRVRLTGVWLEGKVGPIRPE